MSFIGDWFYGLVILGIVAVLVILIYVAWWALFADKRNQSRRRCPRCWYDLAYSPGMTCGECGFTATREVQFHTVRHRYRIAAAAILGCVGIAALVNEQVTQTGWASALPTRALIWLMPLGSGPNNSISREITSRAAMGRLSNSDWAAIIDRCAAGDFANRPTSATWRAKYGNFIWIWRQRLVGEPTIDARLNAVPPWVDVVARDTWPTRTPMVFQVDVKDWWSWGTECRVRVTSRIDDKVLTGPKTFIRTGDDRIPRRGFTLTIPAMDESTVDIAIDLEVARRPMKSINSRATGTVDDAAAPAKLSDDPDWTVVSTQTVMQKIRIDKPDRPPLTAIEGNSQIDALVAQVFSNGVVKWSTGLSPVRVRVDQRATSVPMLDEVAIGVHVDLMRDGALARRLNLWWLGGDSIDDRNYGFEIEYENLELLRTAGIEDGRWKMVITSDESLALRAAGGKKFWKGQIILPMTVQSMTGESPARAWWKEE